MNIFVLDKDIVKSAKAHCNPHVVKMPLETAQLLCTARHELGESADTIPYRKTHVNHPCSIWARESLYNYVWLCRLGSELCKEYTHRYGRVHKCQAVIDNCFLNIPEISRFKTIYKTKHPQAMPDEYKMDDAVMAYRNYYNHAKSHLLKYTDREMPHWIEQCLEV